MKNYWHGPPQYNYLQEHLMKGHFFGDGVLIRYHRSHRYFCIMREPHNIFRGREADKPFHTSNLFGVLGAVFLNENLIDLLEFANLALPCKKCLFEVYHPDVNGFMVEGRLEKTCTHDPGVEKKFVIPRFDWFRWFEFVSLPKELHEKILKSMSDATFYHNSGDGYKIAVREFDLQVAKTTAPAILQ